MSVKRHGTFWQRLWACAPVSPARLTGDSSTIRLEIRKDALQQLASTEPAATALLQAFAGTNHGDWGGPEFPVVPLEVSQLQPLLNEIAEGLIAWSTECSYELVERRPPKP